MADNPVIGITTDLNDENLIMKYHYSDVIADAGGIPLLIPISVNPALYAEIIDGLLIPGGDDLDPAYYGEESLPMIKPVPRKRSDFELSLLSEIVQFQKPILGICYGMQLINVFLGGTLYQDIPKQISVEINHKTDYHIIVIAENRFLQKGEFSVNSTHHQGVKKLGSGLSVLAYSADHLIEGFYKEDSPFLLGVQWHPEREPNKELSRDLFSAFIKASYGNK
jgi:putative glutamine amidotransferase